ncbi:MAG: arylamine N-acetyltransferase [Acidobacteriia bacterium]|nr:arylamine N-acetyltransferase [Terriglobia bacterium]
MRVLGIEAFPSGIEGLRALARAHLYRAPFENISKLLLFSREKRGRFFSLGEFLEGIEKQDLGGTCYSLNPYLATLLRALGYETDLLGADMPPRLNTHTCLRVRVHTVAYHVDVGYGAPFREPVRLDRLPFELIEGANRYVLERRGERLEMSVFAGQQRVHGYSVNDSPRSQEFFAGPMQDSFAPTATFLNCIRICSFFEDRSAVLLNRTLSIYRGGNTAERELNNIAEWQAALASELRMPRCPAAAAIRAVEHNSGKPLFELRAAEA